MSGLRDDQAGIGRRAALAATGSQECRQADAPIVDLVPAPGMLAQELAVDLGQAVHRRRPLRGRLVDRPGCARSVRRDRGGEHEPRDPQQAHGLEHVQHAGRIGLVCGSRALLGPRREDAGRVEQDIRPGVADGLAQARPRGHVALDPAHGRVVAQRRRGRRDVQARDVVPARREGLCEVGPEESGPAGHGRPQSSRTR